MRLVLTFILAFGAAAYGQDHWVSTWAASPQQPRVAPPRPANAPANATAPAAPAAPPAGTFNNQTVRMIVHTSIGGRRARVTLSNAYGTAAVTIGAAHIALRDKESAIVPASDRALMFGGKPSFTIPMGAAAVSDPVDIDVPKLGDLVISVYAPGETGPASLHSMGLHTAYVAKGDATAQNAMADGSTLQSWYWISSVDVLAPAEAGTIVAYGDSITDGATSTRDTDRSWPSVLAARLLANPATANLAIVNQGISGNGVLREITGTNALARFDRDVLAQPGVRYVMIMEGINDIGQGLGPSPRPGFEVTADDLIAGYKQMIERAHMHGIKVIGCTLTPYVGASYASEKGEAARMAVNQWTRTSGAYDAVVDFEAATRDPDNPKQFRPGYNNTDHLHPNDAGYKAMADAVDLSIFAPKPMTKR